MYCQIYFYFWMLTENPILYNQNKQQIMYLVLVSAVHFSVCLNSKILTYILKNP